MKKRLFLILSITLLTCLFPALSHAQEEGEMDYSWGMAVKVSAKEITLMEYDYETDQDINVVYRIDPDVELYNIESMEDIAEGDTIEIDYVLDDKDKIAKVITLVVAAGEETDYLPEEDMEY